MTNLPSYSQLQDDPFGFRSKDRQKISVDSPPQAQPSQRPPAALGASRARTVAPQPVQMQQNPERTPGTLGAARARTPLPYTQGQPDNGATQNATQGGGSFSVRNLFAPGQYEALSQTMRDLVVHDPAGKKQPAPSSAAGAPPQTSAPAPQAAPAAASNAPAPAADPAKTIAKGRALGPGLTISQTDGGEVAAFGPDGQAVNLKDHGVRSRFNLPTKSDRVAGYGKRADGTEKGSGYLGELKMTDGSGRVMTELGVGVNIDGKEVEIPTVVPTLSKQELSHLLSGGKPTPEIIKKAADHARTRLASGLSPFANSGGGDVARRSGDIGNRNLAPKTANPGTVLSESRPSPITRKQMDVYNTDRANGYTGSRDYISPFLSPDRQHAQQNEIYAQRQADLEATAQRLATENTMADIESQRTGVPTTSARNRSMLPTSERVMGERQDRMAHERVSEQRSYNLETAKQAAAEKDASMLDSTTRRGQDIDDEKSRRAAQNDAENRKAGERIAQIQYGSKTQRDYQREAMLKARSEAIQAALSSDPKSVESPEFQKWLDKTYPLMTPEERLELEKQGASAPDPKQYK